MKDKLDISGFDVALLNSVQVRHANLNPITFWKNKSIATALNAFSKIDTNFLK